MTSYRIPGSGSAVGISPIYTIHQYRSDFYKVVAFKGRRDPDAVCLRRDAQNNDNKLASNFSRARSMVLQYALCNPWDYFFTGTLDETKFNRYDLDTYQTRLSQFIRDKRKAYDSQIQFLLIPERHKDGAWHIHGLIYGLPASAIRPFRPPEPQHLIDGGFLNWPDYMEKFGFCSLAPIKDPLAVSFYITKYISKDLSQRAGDLGKHLYFHSRPLQKAEAVSDIYCYNSRLDSYCTEEYDFCKTGMVDKAPWYFPYQWDGVDILNLEHWDPDDSAEPVTDPLQHFDPRTVDPFYEQLNIAGWCNGNTPGSEPGTDGSIPSPATIY